MALPTTGLVLHLDADDLSGTHSDGDRIATWPDGSGAGNDATQATTINQPFFETNVINGLPVVRCNIVGGERHHFTLSNPLSGASAGEIFAVLAIKNDPPNSDGATGLWRFGSAANHTHYPWRSDSTIYENFGSTSRHTVGDPVQSLTDFHVYNVHSAASDWEARIDGTSIFSSVSNTVGWASTAVIGRSAVSIDYMLDGDFAAIIAYSRKLTTQERTDAEEYLNTRFFVAPDPTTNELSADTALPFADSGATP